MLTVSQAINLILAETHAGLPESVRTEAALQRVLSTPIMTPHDSPPFDKSLMDGFAVNSSTVSGTVSDELISFSVRETLTAGKVSEQWSGEGQAVRVMTGAALPPGVDCVVPIEQVRFSEENPRIVGIPRRSISREYCILKRGESARGGEMLLAKGVRLYAQHLATLAEFGISEIEVFKTPQCAVLATGDELVEFSQDPGPGRIRNSNEPMLLGQLQQNGAHPIGLGIARDDQATLRAGIQQGLKSDFLLLTGGVSAGIRDLVPAELLATGVRKVFHGVHMKPGKPLWFGVYESGFGGSDGGAVESKADAHRCYVFGLPGNPVSALACFELFVRPSLRKFSGIPDPNPLPLKAMLSEPYQVRGDRPVYHPVKIDAGEQGLAVRPLRWVGSADLRATVEANGMALFEPSSSPIAAGTLVSVWLWAGLY